MKKLHYITALTLAAAGLALLGACTNSHVHRWSNWEIIKEATCTEKGEQKKTCVCGETMSQKIPALDHEWSEWETTKESTCAEKGEKSRICAVCNTTEEKELALRSHVWGKWETSKEATCAEKGEQTRTCTNCNTTEEKSISTTAHIWGEWEVITAATCLGKGEQTRTCTNCGTPEQQSVAALGHEINWISDGLTHVGECTRGDYRQAQEACTPHSSDVGNPCTVCGHESIYADKFDFTLNEDKQSYAVSLSAKCIESDLVIPELFAGLPVTVVSNFAKSETLKSVKFPNTIISISMSAFRYSKQLEKVELNEGLKEIQHSAFSYCEALKEIILPDSLETLGVSAFLRCHGLKTAKLPSNLTEIPQNIFNFCESLTEIFIPETVTKIQAFAFQSTRLKNVKFPSRLTSLGDYAFKDCTSLSEIIFPEDFENIEIGARPFLGTAWQNSQPGDLIYFGKVLNSYKYEVIPEGTVVDNIRPDTVEIASSAFSGITSNTYNGLTQVIIPSSVTYIGDCAFYFCNNLKSVVIPSSVTVAANAFADITVYTDASKGSVSNEFCHVFRGCTLSEDNSYVVSYTTGNHLRIITRWRNPDDYLFAPQRKGYDFGGWKDEKTGTIYDTKAATSLPSGITLLAIWNKQA